MSKLSRFLLPLLLLTIFAAPSLQAGGKVGIYGLRQVPGGADAKEY